MKGFPASHCTGKAHAEINLNFLRVHVGFLNSLFYFYSLFYFLASNCGSQRLTEIG